MKVKKARLRDSIEDRYTILPLRHLQTLTSAPTSPSNYDLPYSTNTLLSTRQPLIPQQRDSLLDSDTSSVDIPHPALYSQLSSELIKVAEEDEDNVVYATPFVPKLQVTTQMNDSQPHGFVCHPTATAYDSLPKINRNVVLNVVLRNNDPLGLQQARRAERDNRYVRLSKQNRQMLEMSALYK